MSQPFVPPPSESPYVSRLRRQRRPTKLTVQKAIEAWLGGAALAAVLTGLAIWLGYAVMAAWPQPAPSLESRYQRLRIGMPQAAVIEIMGPNHRTLMATESEVAGLSMLALGWSDGDHEVTVALADGKLSTKTIAVAK